MPDRSEARGGGQRSAPVAALVVALAVVGWVIVLLLTR